MPSDHTYSTQSMATPVLADGGDNLQESGGPVHRAFTEVNHLIAYIYPVVLNGALTKTRQLFLCVFLHIQIRRNFQSAYY